MGFGCSENGFDCSQIGFNMAFFGVQKAETLELDRAQGAAAILLSL
jgi:hypothetical protein